MTYIETDLVTTIEQLTENHLATLTQSQLDGIDQFHRGGAEVASDPRCKSTGVVPGFMIRLGDGADSFVAVGGLTGSGGAWPELAGWIE